MKVSLGASENGFELGLAQFLIDPQGNIERDCFLRGSVTPHGAAVFSAVTGIDHHRLEAMAGVRRDRRATPEKNGGCQREKGAKSRQWLHWK